MADQTPTPPVAPRKPFNNLVDKRIASMMSSQLQQLGNQISDLQNFVQGKADSSAVSSMFSGLSSRVQQVEQNYATSQTLQTLTGQIQQKADLSALQSLVGRVKSVEDWRSNKSSFLGAPMAADLKTDYNLLTTVLSALVGGLNTTNARVNAMATRQNAIQSALQAREIAASSV